MTVMTSAQRSQVQVIQSRPNVEMLTEQRQALQQQVEQYLSRRNLLYAQFRTMNEGRARGELESRMNEIDARLYRLDDQIERLNNQIAEATAGGAGGTRVVVEPRPAQQITIPPFNFARERSPDMREIGGIMAAEAVALVLIGLAFWRFGMRRMRQQVERAIGSQTGQLNQLQQAIDVIGVEVERISEGQRYVAKVLSEGSAPAARVLLHQQDRER
jgi:chaperonin cofactor prefoldin